MDREKIAPEVGCEVHRPREPERLTLSDFLEPARAADEPRRKRIKQLNVEVPRALKKLIQECAAQEGISIADFVRVSALDRCRQSKRVER